MTVKIHDWGGKRGATYGFEWFAEQVTQRTGGAIKFDILYGGILVKTSEQLDNLVIGLFDIGQSAASHYPTKAPLNTVYYLPFLTSDPLALAKAQAEVINTIPELQAELTALGVKFLLPCPTTHSEYIGKKKVEKPDDFRGMTVLATGDRVTAAEAWGASAVYIPTAEAFESLQRGTVDAVLYGIHAIFGFGLHEAGDNAKYITDMGIGASGYYVIVNLDFWNNLEPRVQQIMSEVAAEEIHPLSGKPYRQLWDEFEKSGQALWPVAFS